MTDQIAERLRQLAMPPEEIRAILSTDDRRVVHRFLELHRERLAEELQDRWRSLDRLERVLVGSAER